MDFHLLFKYNHNINRQFVDVFSDAKAQTERSVKLFSHVLNAHHIWLKRVMHQEPTFAVWQVQEAASFGKLNDLNLEDTMQILREAVLEEEVSYTNSQGKAYTNTVDDILMHVIIHSAHHRAQIASDWKANGVEPPISDYIFWRR